VFDLIVIDCILLKLSRHANVQVPAFPHGFPLIVSLLPTVQPVFCCVFSLLNACLTLLCGIVGAQNGVQMHPKFGKCDR
jgi:hypothetical protein